MDRVRPTGPFCPPSVRAVGRGDDGSSRALFSPGPAWASQPRVDLKGFTAVRTIPSCAARTGGGDLKTEGLGCVQPCLPLGPSGHRPFCFWRVAWLSRDRAHWSLPWRPDSLGKWPCPSSHLTTSLPSTGSSAGDLISGAAFLSLEEQYYLSGGVVLKMKGNVFQVPNTRLLYSIKGSWYSFNS